MLLLHTEVGEHHRQAHKKFVAVAMSKLARCRLRDALLCIGEHLLGSPLRAPLLLGDGSVVGQTVVLASLFK